ncbi:MAG: alpha/beta hydrolase [Candidatus Levybacteria bacterium]|nr:alpha/beta hydrolase [Candidatus Levybacteria bacterium]
MPKIILLHGSLGCTSESFWLPSVKKELEKLGLPVIAKTFPENQIAPMNVWMPFLKSLKPDEQTILIGHSSGAILAMRYAETHKLLGSVLVSTYHTDLDDEDEKQSGYFTNPWNWKAIKDNQKWIVQFASTDDPFIPIEEARFIHKKLQTDYHEYTDQGHFGLPIDKKEFPELLTTIKKHLKASY